MSQTRRGSKSDDEEALVQRVVQRVLGSEKFMTKLIENLMGKITECVQRKLNDIDTKGNELELKLEQTITTLDMVDQFARRNNLRIYNLPEAQKEDTSGVFIKFCKEKVGIDLNYDDIEFCHRLRGKKDDQFNPIFVGLCKKSTKDLIFKKKSKLKGSATVIREDLTNRRLSIMSAAIKKLGTKNVWSNGGNVFCKFKGKVVKIASLGDLVKLGIVE